MKKAKKTRGATRMRERGMKAVPVYLTAAEHAAWTAYAKSHRCSLAALFRAAFMAQYPTQ